MAGVGRGGPKGEEGEGGTRGQAVRRGRPGERRARTGEAKQPSKNYLTPSSESQGGVSLVGEVTCSQYPDIKCRLQVGPVVDRHRWECAGGRRSDSEGLYRACNVPEGR